MLSYIVLCADKDYDYGKTLDINISAKIFQLVSKYFSAYNG
jgi:hypothetical protein